MPWKSRWSIEIPVCSLPTYLFQSPTAKLSDKPLIIEGDKPENYLSHHTYREWSMRFAAGLKKAGLQTGDRLLLFSPNTIFFTTVQYGTIMAGGIFSAANPTYVPREAAYQLKDSGAKFFLVGESNLETGIQAAKESGFPLKNLYVFDDGTKAYENRTSDINGMKSWTSFLVSKSEASSFRWEDFTSRSQQTRTAVLNYSSGTTGLPKGVEITHYNYIANCEQTNYVQALKADHKEWQKRARGIAFLPMYHAYGQTYYGLNYPLQGIPMYLMKKYDFVNMLEYIEKYRVTNLTLVPPIVVQLTKRDECTKYDLSSLEAVGCGAAPLGKETILEFERRFDAKVQIRQGWGMTEVTCSAVSWDPNMEENIDLAAVGELNPNISAMLVDDDEKEIHTADGNQSARGELWVRGPNVMKAYWKRAAETARTFSASGQEDRWFKTGDVAFRDALGLIHVVDRKKELIKVKGLQVAPSELESQLLDHPEVDDAVVVGVTIKGEEAPRAYIVLRQNAKVGPREIAKWLEERVSRYKRLAGGCVAVDSIPKNPSGKLLRKELRERAKKEVGDVDVRQSRI